VAVPSPSLSPAAKPAAPAAAPAAFNEQAVADFYRGKTLRVIVGYSAGGQFDLWARLLAKYMPKYLPGTPNIIVENMTGAGGLVTANYLYNAAPKDGTAFGTFTANLVTSQLIRAQGVEFDARQFNWVGAPMNSTMTCAAAESSGVLTIEDSMPPKRQELIMGGTAPGSAGDDYTHLLNNLLSTNIKLVSGYPGNAQIRTAIENGEVHAYCLSLDAAKVQHRAWDEAGTPKYNIIMQFGMQKNPQLPNVTNVYDLMKSEEDKALLRMEFAPDQAFFPFIATPGIPADRVAALRKGFLDALRDPELEAEAARLNLDKDPQPGERVQQLVNELLATPDPVVQRYKQIVGR
jgi:tripartite-type tricarboxylate transporter receptor subunit TctC